MTDVQVQTSTSKQDFQKTLVGIFLQQDLNQFLNGTLHNYILKVEALMPHCCNKLHLFPLESKGFLK